MYQHLVDFSEFTGQRILSVLTMANAAGGVAGGFLAWILSGKLPLPLWLLAPLLISLGVALTWPHESIPLGRLLLMWIGFQLRRRLAPTTLLVHQATYTRPAHTAPRILMGGVVHYGGHHLDPDAAETLFDPPAPELALQATPGAPTLESALR